MGQQYLGVAIKRMAGKMALGHLRAEHLKVKCSGSGSQVGWLSLELQAMQNVCTT